MSLSRENYSFLMKWVVILLLVVLTSFLFPRRMLCIWTTENEMFHIIKKTGLIACGLWILIIIS